MAWKRTAYLLAMALLAGGASSSCSYHAAIRRDFVQTPADGAGGKIPLRVGLVQSSEFMDKMFIQNDGTERNIAITVQPYLADAIYAQLGSMFAGVVRVRPAEMASRDVDLLIIPSYTYTTTDAHRVLKTFSMNQELTYRFQDRLGHVVATVTSRDTL